MRLSTQSRECSNCMNSEHNIQLCIQCALPVVTIMALWHTHCWIALSSHKSAQTASSERSKYANSEHLLRGSPPNPESAQTV